MRIVIIVKQFCNLLNDVHYFFPIKFPIKQKNPNTNLILVLGFLVFHSCAGSANNLTEPDDFKSSKLTLYRFLIVLFCGHAMPLESHNMPSVTTEHPSKTLISTE